MKTKDFQTWLERYGRAWTEGDPAAVVELFAAKFNKAKQCTEFREWWDRKEA